MKHITIASSDEIDTFVCQNEAGQSITLSGNGGAVGPMEAVLMALAGCSSIDVIMILKKMKQDIKDIKVDVKGDRAEEVPKVYTNVHVHFTLTGDIKDKKAKEAIDLSIEKYCSVAQMLDKTAVITTSFEIVG
jgi:putative redox protein